MALTRWGSLRTVLPNFSTASFARATDANGWGHPPEQVGHGVVICTVYPVEGLHFVHFADGEAVLTFLSG